MLGLTATPDRTDQSDILSLCDDNLVFDKNLFAGISAGFAYWHDPDKESGPMAVDLDSLIIQNPHKMGYEGVKAICRRLEGKEVPKDVDTGVELLTQDRLSDPKVMELLASQI